MKTWLKKIAPALLTTILILSVLSIPQPASAAFSLVGIAADSLGSVFEWILLLILQVFTLLTYLTGTILNFVVNYTVVNMADKVREMEIIDTLWKTIRDIANMGFIFILLYAAIQTILGIGKDTKRIIVYVITVAVLINFSLFATKIVIDASNVLAITFYGAMAPEALTGEGDGVIENRLLKSGLANTMMEPLRLSSIYEAKENGLGHTQMIIIAIMGSVFALVAAFVFAAVAMMFIIRYVVLLLVMVFSPIAFMAWVHPNLKKHFNTWWDALSGQAFFAPIYLFITWVVIQIASNLPSSGIGLAEAIIGTTEVVEGKLVARASMGGMETIMNFIIVIVLLITSLMLAKKSASKAGSMVTGATKWLTGAAGNVAFGGVGWAGRKTLGRYGNALADNTQLQADAYGPEAKEGFAGMRARLNLGLARKLQSGSFDARRAVVPGRAVGEAIEGTLGRTRFGRAIGADDVNILQNIEAGQMAAAQTGVGQGREGGYKERQEEKKKRIDTRRAANIEEAKKVEAENNITENLSAVEEFDKLVALESAANAGGTALSDADKAKLDDYRDPTKDQYKQINKFEKAINNASTKEIEAIVESNKQLLTKQEFANRINVQQLEAINKSDKFSESEKGALKNNRFSAFNIGSDGFAALAIPEADRTAEQKAAANIASSAIRNLKDAELEMLDPELLGSEAFVSQLKPSQIDAINKSSRFTNRQRETLGKLRQEPIKKALILDPETGEPDPERVRRALRELGPKEQAGLMRLDGRDGKKVALDPAVLFHFTPQMLKRMASDMSPGDIQTLRDALEDGGSDKTKAWLANNPDNFS